MFNIVEFYYRKYELLDLIGNIPYYISPSDQRKSPNSKESSKDNSLWKDAGEIILDMLEYHEESKLDSEWDRIQRNVSSKDVVSGIAEICPDGVDLAIEASGRPTVMATALSAVRSRGGRAVVIGNAPKGQTIVLDPLQFNLGKSLLGTWGGDSVPDRDFQKFASFMIEDEINVMPLFSSPYTLENINDALDDLEEGRIGRPLIEMSQR